MACVKSFTCNPSQSHYNCKYNLCGGKTDRTLLDSNQRRLAPVINMLQLLTPISTSSSLSDSSDCHHYSNMDNSVVTTGLETSVDLDSMHIGTIPLPSLNINCSFFTSTANGVSTKKHSAPGSPIPSQIQLSALEDRCSVNNSYIFPVSQKSMQSNFRGSQLSDDGPSNYNTQNQNMEVISNMDHDTSCCSFKSVPNLALILSAPRKIVRKGRPSSKKQRKRQREKSKLGHSSSVTNGNTPTHSNSGLQSASNQSHELVDSHKVSSAFENTVNKTSNPVKVTSKLCPAQLFIRLKSSSDEVDDEISGDDDDIHGWSKWSANDHKLICISPIKGFDFALNLDSIFKQKNIPENAAHIKVDVASASSSYGKNGLCRNLSRCLSEDEFSKDSDIQIYTTSMPSDFTAIDYATPLSEDILFPKKCSSANLTGTAVDVNDDQSSAYSIDLITCSLETLKDVNAKWNENYPSSGFRSFHQEDDIKDPSIKVHFATEPHLVTVHYVGTEERGGTWHQYALDRERFERRVLELEKIISPVLDASHRAKIREHRCCQD